MRLRFREYSNPRYSGTREFKETNDTLQSSSTPSCKTHSQKGPNYARALLLPDSQGQLGGEGGLNYIFVSRTPTELLTKFQRQGRSLPVVMHVPPLLSAGSSKRRHHRARADHASSARLFPTPVLCAAPPETQHQGVRHPFALEPSTHG